MKIIKLKHAEEEYTKKTQIYHSREHSPSWLENVLLNEARTAMAGFPVLGKNLVMENGRKK